MAQKNQKNPESLLNSTFICEACHKSHTIDVQTIVYADDAVEKMVSYVEPMVKNNFIAVLADNRTYKVIGERLVTQMQSIFKDKLHCFILPDQNKSTPVCDENTKDDLQSVLPKVDVLVAVGSGVINDLTKWVAFERKVPYVVLATAASMNGYASANVAAKVKGLKVLFKAASPKGVFALPKVIEQAPVALTAAGLGDALAKPVSSADWMLNHLLFEEYYCQYAVDIVSEQEKIYTANPEGIAARNPEAIKALFYALCYSGISMSIAGSSAPASGGEHLVSHTLDMIADRDHQKHDLHGRQVGIGTILSAALYEKLLCLDHIVWQPLPAKITHSFWGSLAGEVEKEYAVKLIKAEQALQLLSDPQKWETIRNELKKIVRSPYQIKSCLEKAGAAHTLSHIGVHDAKVFVNTWLASFEMRSRFTILDLVRMANIMDTVAEEIVEKWVL